ncbi:calpain-1 catalytic subunit-like [Discoglossus pictus]
MAIATQRRALIPSLVPIAMSQYIALRDVTGRYELPRGRYLIIPTTYQPYQECAFTLRVFSEKQHTLSEIDCEIHAQPSVFQEGALKVNSTEFAAHFARLSGEDQEISPEELQLILTQVTAKRKIFRTLNAHLKTDGFSLETCRQLVNFVDQRGHGKLQLEEFRCLWSKIKEWESIFKSFDKDWSGTMDSCELRVALEATGFHLNNQMVESISRRFGDDFRRVDFDSFISCLSNLINIFDNCRRMDKDKDGVISVGEQEWLQLTNFQ